MAWITLLRRPAAALAAAGLLALFGCGGKSNDETTTPTPTETIKVTVKVNYSRIPLVKDANGVPTGLETNSANFKSLPARGVQVLYWEAKEETNPDGTKARVWLNTQFAVSDNAGSATFQVTKNADAFLEVLSLLSIAGSGSIRIVGDPSGINSSLFASERVTYALRKGLDGTSPAGNPIPAAKAASDATITFDVGLDDKWWLTLLSSTQIAQAQLEPVGTGSRVLAILDSIYTMGVSGLSSANPGDSLDLHYRLGISEPRGSFIEFDRTKFPLSFHSATQRYRYFGSIRGGSSNDDAFDEGIIFPMIARAGLWATNIVPPSITGKALPDFLPDTALVEAMPFIQACTLLKSPYLADTSPSGSVNTDIRDLGSFASGSNSGPAIAALGWDIALKANALPNPGTVVDWEKINPLATARFFGLRVPVDFSDRPNLYLQLAKLKEAKTSAEPIDLAAIFTDAVLTSMTAPYSVVWPRPTSGADASYVLDWGKDPNSAAAPLAPIALSMAKAVSVDGTYPNTSSGEAAYRRFTLSKDTAYNLRVISTPPVLPAGSKVEVRLFSPSASFEFTGSDSPANRVVLRGLADPATPYLVRVSLISPFTAIPDVNVTVVLDAVN